METLPEISLGTAALIIFALCAGYMFIRGLARTFVNAAFLTLSAWVGFRVWQEAPSLAAQWKLGTSEFVTTGLPVVAVLATFIILRKLIKFFRAPVPQAAEDAAPRSFGQLVFRLLVTVIPAALLCITVATLIHHASSIAEIRDSAESSENPSSEISIPERLKTSISFAIPEWVMEKLDPFASKSRVELAKMIVANQEKSPEPIINPDTGRPYPRAIIIDDPELKILAKEGRFSTLLRHPALSEALNDPLIRKALGL